MRYKRIIPVALFLLAAILSTYLSPAQGHDNTSPSEASRSTAGDATGESFLYGSGGEDVNTRSEQVNSLGIQVDQAQVDSIQVTLLLLLTEDNTQGYLPIVER
jgi:hypothetical protein